MSILAGLSASHVLVDGYVGFPPPLLNQLALSLGVSYAAVSPLLGLGTITAAAANILAGFVCDRWQRSSRWLVLAGAAGTVALMSIIGVCGSYLTLGLVIAVGSFFCGVYHPPAFAAAGEVFRPRRHVGVSVMMTLGIAAYGLGPACLGCVVAWGGLGMTPWFIVPGGLLLVMVAFLLFRREWPVAGAEAEREHHAAGATTAKSWWWISLLFVNTGARAFAQMGVIAIVSYLMERNWGLSVAASGLGVGALQAGAGLGALAGAWVTPTGRERRTMLWCTPLNVLVLVPMGLTGGGIWFLWLFAFGLAVQAPNALAVSLAQHIVPARSALVSGLIVGVSWAVGAMLASCTTPRLIEHFGQASTMAFLVLPLVLSWAAAWLLPGGRTELNR